MLCSWCVSAASLVLLSGLLPVACQSIPISPSSSSANDVVITRSQFGQVVSVSQGQTLSIARPADFSEWQVDYAGDVLQPLTPPDRMRSPGPDGWRFKALAPGVTDLTVSPLLDGDRGAVSPPAPPRFTVTIRVR